MAANGFQSRGHNSYYGSGVQPDQWSKSSYVSDHVCRPVLIDSEGRKRPIIAYPTTMDCCVTEKLEQCQSPVLSEYKHIQTCSPMADRMKDYGYVNGKSPVQDYPPSVEDFMAKIQTEAGRPDRLDILNTSSWRQIHNSSPQPQLSPNFYDRHHSNHGEKEWTRPIGYPNDNNDGYYYNKNHITYSDPPMAMPEGWGITNRPPWTATQSHESTLSQATNNIGMAMDNLKESATAKPSSAPFPRYSAPFERDERKVRFTETIDSKEAARRYGKPNLGFRATKTAEAYTTTIDSKEAARKYNGTRE